MDKEKVYYMMKGLLKELEKVTVLAMEQSGVKRNTNLSKSVKYVQVNETIALEVNYYYPYVSDGRKPRVRKVPISALIEYIKQMGIVPKPGQTINQLAFAIQTTIYKQGINPKNYIDKVVNVAGELTQEEIADGLMEGIANDLVEAFEI